MEVVFAFLRFELFDGVRDGLPEVRNGPGRGGSEHRFEFGKGHLDGIEVGRIRRQVEQARACSFDGLAHACNLVRGKIVHDDDITEREFRHEHLPDIGQKGIAVHRSIERHAGCQAVDPQPGGECRGLPMAMRNGGPATLALWCTTIETRHFGRGRGFVDEDQLFWIEIELAFEPLQALFSQDWTVLLRRMRRLFLRVMP